MCPGLSAPSDAMSLRLRFLMQGRASQFFGSNLTPKILALFDCDGKSLAIAISCDFSRKKCPHGGMAGDGDVNLPQKIEAICDCDFGYWGRCGTSWCRRATEDVLYQVFMCLVLQTPIGDQPLHV